MATVDFWTPITYREPQISFIPQVLQIVDDYFYLGGKKAIALPHEIRNDQVCALLLDFDATLLSTALKVASYLTIVLPYCDAHCQSHLAHLLSIPVDRSKTKPRTRH